MRIVGACLILLLAGCAPAVQRTAAPASAPTEAVRAGDRTVTETSFTAEDGTELRAVLSLPEGEGPFPVVVTLHGGAGGRDYRVLRGHAAPGAASPTVTILNGEPWAVYALGYRAGAILGAEEDDVIAGIRAIKKDPRIDPSRVAVFGGSHGGQLALRAAIRMGDEISCVAAGSPWMTNPQLYFTGDPQQPPLSDLSPQAREYLLDRRTALLRSLERNTGLPRDRWPQHFAERSIEGNAEEIRVPTLLLTSHSDVQVPHRLLEPLIARLRGTRVPLEVVTVKDSLHGFYWGREGEFGARAGAGPKTDAQRAEEARVRDALQEFLQGCLSAQGGRNG